MKKISQIIRLLDSINAVDITSMQNNIDEKLFELSGAMTHNAENILDNIRRSGNTISAEHTAIIGYVEEYKQSLYQQIENQQADYYAKSEEIYKDSQYDTVEYLLDRRKNNNLFENNIQLRNTFYGRLTYYNRWKFPAVEIRPAHGEFTDVIKACDPLYLLDTDIRMFDYVRKLWAPTYQKRLRYYTFSEIHQELFYMLPKNQFGFVLCVDYFEHKPLHIINNYLKDIFCRLRPGGTFMFTYNDCDKVYGAKNVEHKFKCYTPGTEIVKLAMQHGYIITKQFNEFENLSWMEITKPGSLTSLRGGQTLGEIKDLGSKFKRYK